MKLRKLLLPISPFYGLAMSVRNSMYDSGKLKSTEFEKPVIVVGNITTGGTGKTPHTEMLLDLFNAEKIKAAVISRGYKRKTEDLIEVSTEHNSIQVGDEPLQIKLKHRENVVVVEKNRVKGIRYIFDTYPTTKVVIMDDGFQHRSVKPKLNIVLVNYHTIDKKDFLLPAGNLREPSSSLERADIIIITKTPKNLNPLEKRILKERITHDKSKNVFCTYFSYGNLYNVADEGKPSFFDKDFYAERNYDVLLVTGIANSDDLHSELKKTFKNVSYLSFADHHQYSEKDIETIKKKFSELATEKKIILTTEKDAMRIMLPSLVGLLKDIPIFFISIEVKFHHDEYKEFKHLILESTKPVKRILGIS